MPKNFQQGQESIIQAVFINPEKTGDNIEGLRVGLYGWDYDNNTWRRVAVNASGELQGVGGGTTPSNLYDAGVYDTAVYA